VCVIELVGCGTIKNTQNVLIYNVKYYNILQELYCKSSLPIKNSSTDLKDMSVDVFLRLL
jgi:hypothetical protein